MKKYLNFFVIVLISVVIFIQCGLDNNTLATVGDLEIKVDEFKEMLKRRYPKIKDLKEIETKSKRDLLDQTIQKKLKVNAAIDLGLDNDPDIFETINKQEENLLGQKYFEVEIVDKLVTKEDIEDFNLRQGYEFKTSFVLIGFKKARIENNRTREQAKKLANEVLEKAKSGIDFNNLIIEYTDDKANKKATTDFEYFKWGQKPKQIQEACWNLNVGEFSDVIETSFGYYILRLEDKRKDPNYVLDNSPENIFRIKKTLYSVVADSGNKMWARKVEQLKEDFSYSYNDAAVNRITQLINEKIRVTPAAEIEFSDQDKFLKMVEWDGGGISLNTIISRYKNNLDRVLRALQDPKNMKKELQNLSLISIAISEARDMGLDEDEQIVKSLTQVKEERLSYLVEQNQVNEQISFTDEDVRKYYDDYPEQFMNPAKLEIWSITVKDEATAKKVANKAKKGLNFESLAKKYSTDKYYKEKGGYLGYRTINSRGSISRKAFELDPNGKISDPFKFKNEWAIVKTGELREKKLRSFQDAVKMVQGRLRNDLLKARRNEWKKQLNEKYTIKINEEAFNEI